MNARRAPELGAAYKIAPIGAPPPHVEGKEMQAAGCLSKIRRAKRWLRDRGARWSGIFEHPPPPGEGDGGRNAIPRNCNERCESSH